MGALRVLNPALRPPIWSGARLVPRGYAVRIPGTPPQSEIAAAWARLPSSQRYVAQRNDGKHKVRRGETLAAVAAVSGISVPRLLAANGWTSPHEIARGDIVHIPMPASRAETSGVTAPVPAVVAENAAGAALQPGAAPQPGAALAPLSRAPEVNEKIAPPAADACGRPCGRPQRACFRATDRQRRAVAGRSTDRQLGCKRLQRRAGRYGHRAGRRDAGAFRRLDRSRFADAACPEQAAQECHGDARPQAQARLVARDCRAIRRRAARHTTASYRRHFSPLIESPAPRPTA